MLLKMKTSFISTGIIIRVPLFCTCMKRMVVKWWYVMTVLQKDSGCLNEYKKYLLKKYAVVYLECKNMASGGTINHTLYLEM